MTDEQKVFLITGANSGIGKVTATALAKTGNKVVMLCRNENKAIQARDEIISASQNESVEILLADLSSQAEVRKAAEFFLQKHHRLDLLVNNAGLIAGSRTTTTDGIELTLAVNHLSCFMLTGLLMPLMQHTASTQGQVRIVTVSSEAHRIAKLDLTDLNAERRYSGLGAYSISKLANIMFTRELATRLKGSNITANALHPGAVASGFGNNTDGWFAGLFRLMKPFLLSSEQGAETSIYLSLSPEVAQISGQYFVRKKQRSPAAIANSAQHCKDLWQASQAMTGLHYL